MKYNFTTIITQEDNYFIAKSAEFGVVSQGKSVDEAQANLKEALELYLEDVSQEELQAATLHKPLVTSLELEYV